MHFFESSFFKICPGRNIFFILFFSLAFFLSVQCTAQDSSASSITQQQIWPEADLFYRFNDKFRILGSLSATQIKNTSAYTDGGISVNLDYFSFPVKRREKTGADSARGHFLWLRGGFSYSPAPPDSNSNYREYTIRTEATTLFYYHKDILISIKNRFDWRFKNDQFLPRYRPKVEIAKDFKTDYLTFGVYANAEYFIALNDNSSNKFTYTFGSEFRVTKHINFEVYFTHQFQNGIKAPSVDALGLALKLYMQEGDRWIRNKLPIKKNNEN